MSMPNTMDVLLGERKELLKKLETTDASIGAELKVALIALLKEDKEITAVRWYQYTPYFNDGEPCEFGLARLEVSFDDGEFTDEGATAAQKKSFKKLDALVSSVPDSALLKTFGDHQIVTLQKGKFTKKSYDDHE
jgi:hypothetical protein